MTRHSPENPRRHYRSPEDMGEEPSNSTSNPTMGEIISRRYSRRGVLKGVLAVTAISTALSPLAPFHGRRAQAQSARSFNFKEVTAGVDEKHHVAEGYNAEVLLRWGDPLFADSPEFDPRTQTAEKQARQFGYNNDFIGLASLPGSSDTSERALLLVNHEYTVEELMFPDMAVQDEEDFAKMTLELVGVEMMAHGGSVVEIRKVNGQWGRSKTHHSTVASRRKPRWISRVPAAGHDLLKTKADPSGKRVLGMLNNCAGGVSPWGTWLSAEENFNGYFGITVPEDGLPTVAASYATSEEQKKAEEERAAAIKARRKETMAGLGDGAVMERYGVPGNWYAWNRWHERFELTKEPNEANRFGWVVEIDPLDPRSTPKKRTALGRLKHEGAENIVNKDGRVVVYMGDDERFDYVYKFVTAGTYDPANRDANMNLLDEGTLYVARYDDTGKGMWLPLVQGQGPLTAENGFASQADVLIKTRLAADLLGATKMDRPEDIAPGRDGSIFVVLTNNNKRKPRTLTLRTRGRTMFSDISLECGPSTATIASRISPGIFWSDAATRRWARWAPLSAPRQPGMAGSGCPIIASSMLRTGYGLQPMGTMPRRPDAPTGYGPSRLKAMVHLPRCISSAALREPNFADRFSHRIPSRSSSPSSIQARAGRIGRNSVVSRHSTIRRRVGPISRMECLPVLQSW